MREDDTRLVINKSPENLRTSELSQFNCLNTMLAQVQ